MGRVLMSLPTEYQNFIYLSRYSRWLEEEGRRETWEELVTRNKKMHLAKFPKLKEEIEETYKLVYEKKYFLFIYATSSRESSSSLSSF